MRTELLTYLSTHLTGTIKLSVELPWEQGGQALYRQNLKRVYVDNEQAVKSVLQPLLSEDDIMQTVTTVRCYLAVDAKNKSSDLDATLAVFAQARTQSGVTNSFRNEIDITTELDQSVEIYTIEYRFYTVA